MRFVLDNNVLLSAALFKGSVPDQTFDKAVSKGEILCSSAILDELISVINRPKFDKYINTVDKIAFIKKFSDLAEFVSVSHRVSQCRDPKDNKFLELARSGKADIIISGDQDLLVLHPFENIPIISPTAFVNVY